MPLPIDITALLSGSLVESERMELKEGWNPESVLHTLSPVIVNYPGPDRSVRLDQLRQGKAIPRRYRNRRIGDFLKKFDITEGRSTGIPKILRAMKKNGSPPPVFDFDEDHSYFLIRLPVHRKEKSIPKQEGVGHTGSHRRSHRRSHRASHPASRSSPSDHRCRSFKGGFADAAGTVR